MKYTRSAARVTTLDKGGRDDLPQQKTLEDDVAAPCAQGLAGFVGRAFSGTPGLFRKEVPDAQQHTATPLSNDVQWGTNDVRLGTNDVR
jgi:hypothetical protein